MFAEEEQKSEEKSEEKSEVESVEPEKVEEPEIPKEPEVRTCYQVCHIQWMIDNPTPNKPTLHSPAGFKG